MPVRMPLDCAVLGPLLVSATGVVLGRTLILASVIAAGLQLLNQAVKFLWMTASHTFELQASARLLSTVLASRYLMRGVLLVIGGIAIPLISNKPSWLVVSFLLALAGEILGRYLFFVSVVPKNMAAS
jgi:formate dehydrogenase iron-sulfur subunit